METTDDNLRRAIWDSKLDAELYVCYWQDISRKYYKRDKKVKIFLTVMTICTVAGWVSAWATVSYPIIGTVTNISWKVLSGFAAITSLILPILDWQRIIQQASMLSGKWSQIQSQYDILWLDYEKGRDLEEVCQSYKDIRDREPKESEADPCLPDDQKLMERRQNNVIKAKGLR